MILNFKTGKQFLVSEGEEVAHLPLLARFKVSGKKFLFARFTEEAWEAWYCILKKVANDLLENYPEEILLVHTTGRSTISVLMNLSKRGSQAFDFFREEIEAFLTLRSSEFTEFVSQDRGQRFLCRSAEGYQFPTPEVMFDFFRLYERTHRKTRKDLRRINGLYVFSSAVKTRYNPEPTKTMGTYYLALGMLVKCYEAVALNLQPTGESHSTHDLEEIEPVQV